MLLAASVILSTAIPVAADDVITINLTRAPLFGFTGLLQQSYILVTAGPSPPPICYLLSPGGGGGLFVSTAFPFLSVNQNNPPPPPGLSK